jgi:lipopolysaccharide export system permease protein
MRLLDRLVLTDLTPNLLIGIGMFTALFIALGPMLAASRFLSEGIPFAFIVKFIVLQTLGIFGQTFPMGMLLAVLLGFGRLSADSETVALFAGGIPFLRIVLPAALLGFLVSGAGYIINDPIGSYARHEIVDMQQHALGRQLNTDKPFDLPDLRSTGVLQATTHIEKGFDLRTGVMRQVTITLYNPSGAPSAIIYARSAHPMSNSTDSLNWQLDDASEDILSTGQILHWQTTSTHALKTTALHGAPDTMALYALLKDDPDALSFGETLRAVASFKRIGMGQDPNVRTDEVALWNKIALPLAAAVFAIVGAPLALRPQRSSKVTGWILALPIILFYYVLYTIMGSVARAGACPPLLAAFFPDLIGLLAGAGLVWKRSVS